MSNIRPSADLRDKYNEISDFCHSRMEPVFITNNGREDLAVMSIEAYRKNYARYELYGLLEEGFEDLKAGRHSNFDEFMEDFWKESQ
ncbi:MAG: type II toxin-antitoxin system Phd/YefM family antitoxin [Oscillospiraceae bacterium]|nr:type II toxin-antitoxin system Phd/YefM family antitoxin [Oscillospiraceae bacterium]